MTDAPRTDAPCAIVTGIARGIGEPVAAGGIALFTHSLARELDGGSS